MRVTVVNEWRLLEEADLDEGTSAVGEDMAYLGKEETGVERRRWHTPSERSSRTPEPDPDPERSDA